MGVGLRGERDVGPARVGLGGGVRVVDDDGHLVGVVHRPPHLELLAGVEPVERRRPLGVDHLDEPLGAVGALRSGDDPARLVGMVGARMGDHGVDRGRRESPARSVPS